MAVERVTTLEGFRALEPDWSRLLSEGGFHTIFQTFRWLLTWWECLSGDSELCLLVIREGGTVVGIAPLMITQPQREVQFIGTPNADYSDIIGSHKDTVWQQVISYLAHNRGEWNTAVLDQMTDRDTSYVSLRTVLRDSGLICREAISDTCAGYEYEGDPAAQATYELPKGSHLKRWQKQLKSIGELTLVRLDTDETLKFLPMLFHLHIVRWADTPSPSKFTHEKHRRFFTELVKRLGPLGQIYFSLLLTGTLPVACAMKFRYGNTIYHYTLAYNQYFSKWSPGAVFVHMQTEEQIRAGYFLDFSRGMQDYKQVVSNRTFTNYRFTIFSSPGFARRHDLRQRIRHLGVVDKILSRKSVRLLRANIERLQAQYGTRGLAGQLARRIVRRIFEQHTLFVFSHTGLPKQLPPPPIAAEIRELTEEHLPVIATCYGASQKSAKYQTLQRRFAGGADCFGVFCDDALVTVSWGLPYTDVDTNTGFALSPGEGEIVLSDGITSVPYQGLGLRSFLMQYQLAKYGQQGKRVLLATAKGNASMLGVIRKFDFTPVRTVRIIKMLGFRVFSL